MTIKGIAPILNVSSIADSIAWFERLGWKRGFTWNDGGAIADDALVNKHGEAHFGSVCAENSTIFLCLDGQGHRAVDAHSEGTWMTWWIESRSKLLEFHELAASLGYEIPQPPRDEPWGICEFHLRHPDGHIFRCSSGID